MGKKAIVELVDKMIHMQATIGCKESTILRLQDELSDKDDIIQMLSSQVDDMIKKESNPRVVLCTVCQKEVNNQMDDLKAYDGT